jgi:hypothetical protein
MKIAFTNDIKLGMNRFAAGDEADLPDRFAQALIAAGHAAAAGEKKSKKTVEVKETKEEEPKTYKTRQLKAEKK